MLAEVASSSELRQIENRHPCRTLPFGNRNGTEIGSCAILSNSTSWLIGIGRMKQLANCYPPNRADGSIVRDQTHFEAVFGCTINIRLLMLGAPKTPLSTSNCMPRSGKETCEKWPSCVFGDSARQQD